MYGKLFERMYTGSMMGSGAMMFAVWPYIIAHMKPNRDRTVFTVELNAALMAVLIGEDEAEIADIIKQCCEPDLKSRTPDKEGRKLIKLSEYLYEVVNGNVYDQIRRAEDLKEGNRRRQAKFYQKKTSENGAPEPATPPPEKPATFPTNIDTESFSEAWNKWLGHLKQKRKPATAHAQELQLKKLANMGEKRAIQTLYHCIEKGWQGIYEPGENSNHETSPSQLSDAELVRQAQL